MADTFWDRALKSGGGQGSAAIRSSGGGSGGGTFWDQALGESRGAGVAAGRGGSSALRRAEETGDKGLIAAAKRIADKVGLDDAANVVMRGLQLMDYPRAAVLSGLIELTDLIPGIEHVEGTDRIQQTGVSWDDFVTNFQRQIGFGDVLEADPDTRKLNIWAKRGIGFLGDVAFDPLTYTGIGAVAKGVGAAGDMARGARARSLSRSRKVPWNSFDAAAESRNIIVHSRARACASPRLHQCFECRIIAVPGTCSNSAHAWGDTSRSEWNTSEIARRARPRASEMASATRVSPGTRRPMK